jgi:hypothetical protein
VSDPREPDWFPGAIAAQDAYRGGWPEEYGPPAPLDPWAASMATMKPVGRSLIDMARTAPGHAARGLMSGIASLGVPPDPIPFGDTSEEFDRRGLEGAQAARKQLEAATYEPQTMAGHYMGSVAEVMGNPLNWAGPGGAAAKAAWNAASGIGGETGAQAAKGTPYEGAARLAGSFGPLALERGWQATGPLVRAMPESVGAFGGKMIQPQPAAPMGELAQPFYSATEQAVGGAKMGQAPAAQWLGTLRNAPGVKPEELQRLGVENWLAQQSGPVSKQALADYVAANKVQLGEVKKGGCRSPVLKALDDEIRPMSNWPQDPLTARDPAQQSRLDALLHEWDKENVRQSAPTKFAQWQLPGGENYRETLLTLPRENPELAAVQKRIEEITMMPSAYSNPAVTKEWDMLRAKERDLLQRQPPAFTGSHWDEPNVLAHYRTNDRVIDGKKTLFWRRCRATGTRRGETRFIEMSQISEPAQLAIRADACRVEAGIERYDPGVPDAPFTTWPDLTLKRAIREGREGGHDQIA